jgi:hypothetical protein
MLTQTRFHSPEEKAPATLCYTHMIYANAKPGWRFVDGGTGNVVGEEFATKAELLAELEAQAGRMGMVPAGKYPKVCARALENYKG